MAQNNLAAFLEVNGGQLDEAERLYRRIFAFWEGLAAGDPSNHEYRSRVALAKLGEALLGLAKLATLRGDLGEARRLQEQAIASSRAALALAPQNANVRQDAQGACTALIETLIRSGEHEGAAKTVAEFVALSPGLGPESLRAASFLARCVPLAEADSRLNNNRRADLAKAYADRAIERLRESVRSGAGNLEALRGDRSLDALRSRADFQGLLAGSAAATATRSP